MCTEKIQKYALKVGKLMYETNVFNMYKIGNYGEPCPTMSFVFFPLSHYSLNIVSNSNNSTSFKFRVKQFFKFKKHF